MSHLSHLFIEVGGRRWCMCCNLFQTKLSTTECFPVPRPCPNDAPAAAMNRAHIERGYTIERDSDFLALLETDELV